MQHVATVAMIARYAVCIVTRYAVLIGAGEFNLDRVRTHMTILENREGIYDVQYQCNH
jgi:hypothetical protein